MGRRGLQDILGTYNGREHRKLGVENNGICLLIAWVNELVQQRVQDGTCGVTVTAVRVSRLAAWDQQIEPRERMSYTSAQRGLECEPPPSSVCQRGRRRGSRPPDQRRVRSGASYLRRRPHQSRGPTRLSGEGQIPGHGRFRRAGRLRLRRGPYPWRSRR